MAGNEAIAAQDILGNRCANRQIGDSGGKKKG